MMITVIAIKMVIIMMLFADDGALLCKLGNSRILSRYLHMHPLTNGSDDSYDNDGIDNYT
jgi:hypothetical protein